MSETHQVWLDWLARTGYGVDYRFGADPPCTLRDLAEAYAHLEPLSESVETWEWCITQETGEWRTA